jgi:hypothetical protein
LTAPGGGAKAADPQDDRRATVAGAVLVAVAVLIGLLLLAKGLSDDGGLLSTSKKAKSTASAGNTSSGGSHATTTTAPIDPSTVHVFVANGSGKLGAAGKVGIVLAGKAYPTPQVGNAATTTKTMLYYTTGQAAQAQLVASSLGLPASSVAAMPSPSPVADLKGSTVLLVIGTDGALDAVESGNPTTTAAKATTTTKKP